MLKGKRIIHISVEPENWNSKTLCGRNMNFNMAWNDKVHKYLKLYPFTIWCKTCKMLYNSNQPNPNKRLK